MSLSVTDLSVGYGTKTVVDTVSLSIGTGQTLGIVGESGSGKTTLVRALGRHLPENGAVLGGGIRVDDVDVLALPTAELRTWRRRDLAFVHQEAGATLDPTMRIGAQLREVLALQGRPRTEVPDLLAAVQLPATVAQRYPFQLSGGQQQRIVIAAALASRPRLLILDEPTTGLDASVEAEILDLLDRLRHELSATVVLVSHDLGLVGRRCDEVAVLYAGRVVERGAAAAVLRAPSHPYTAALLGSAPKLGVPRTVRRLTAIPGRPPVPGSTEGCAFAPRCPFADVRCTSEEPVERVVDDRAVRCHHVERLRPELQALASPPVSLSPAPEPDGVRLVVDGLTRRYGKYRAVDDVSFTIRRGEVFGLVGESGSGKTTVARTIAGLPAGSGSGTVRLENSRPRGVQMVFQQPDATLNPSQRVRTVLARALRTLGGRGTVEDLATRTQVEPALLPARTTDLSGGQKQRIAIARAFAGEPDLVVCDEPVSALDVSVQAGVLELLAEQRERTGTSYLFISHDLAVVGYLADRVGVLYRGRLVEVGPTEAVLSGPHHPYTAALVSATALPDTDRSGTGCRFAARCPHYLGPRCDTEEPELREITPGHTVRCHLPIEDLPTDAEKRS
ncbi:ABC transporter ATP-binding protein [Cryptosporangium aurantiacum]|uniref:Peptide/nickel transport system ATP-binding protein n=1 Tax=Cryptosporangium aurantiacum TaxID=134849 RepID=A0A1M7KBI8_9ACTN|nr:ABC transporter ATP-binding protein [Cryptosporangium aurantiacum]SHM62217.1 peptide/nickel transport system ATP-binding protein [Cryptosporangium aurantiacum]